jgi:hypothetical protein
MMYLAGQLLACAGAAYLGAMSSRHHDIWILVATVAAIVGVAMSVYGHN